MSSTRGIARLDCLDIISKNSSAVQLFVALLSSDPRISGRCTGSFPRQFVFIGDRHFFNLLLVCFCMFSVQIQSHHFVLEIFSSLMLDYHVTRAKCNIRARYSHGVCSLVCWCLHCALCFAAHESCTCEGPGFIAKIQR